MLQYSRYPYYLKKRIVGPNGHLSNEMAGKTINYLLLDKDLSLYTKHKT